MKKEFKECEVSGYAARTKINAGADVTLRFAVDFNTAGEKCTLRAARDAGKLVVDVSMPEMGQGAWYSAVEAVKGSLKDCRTLNIAGNGMHTFKEYGWTQRELDDYITEFMYGTGYRGEVWTGGQTGADEAGAQAAIALGLDLVVCAPRGWMFRGADGVDVWDERAFKGRFGVEVEKKRHGIERVKLVYNQPVPAGVIRMDRGGPWGNPFKKGDLIDSQLAPLTRSDAVRLHMEYLRKEWKRSKMTREFMMDVARKVKAGEVVKMGCWCGNMECHVDNWEKAVWKLIDGGHV